MPRGSNDDIYRGKITEQLADADLNTTEQIIKTTDIRIPPFHDHGSLPLITKLRKSSKGVQE